MLSSSTSICKFYRTKQGCRFKDSCKYRHFDSPARSTIDCIAEVKSSEAVIAKTPTVPLQSHNSGYRTHILEKNEAISVNKVITHTQQSNSERGDRKFQKKKALPVYDVPVPGTDDTSFFQPSVHEASSASKSNDICKFFFLKGWCGYGGRCSFVHLRELAAAPKDVYTVPFERRRVYTAQRVTERSSIGRTCNEERNNFDVPNVPETRISQESKVCKYYLSGYCYHGRSCRYVHQRLSQKTTEREGNKKSGEGAELTSSSDIKTSEAVMWDVEKREVPIEQSSAESGNIELVNVTAGSEDGVKETSDTEDGADETSGVGDGANNECGENEQTTLPIEILPDKPIESKHTECKPVLMLQPRQQTYSRGDCPSEELRKMAATEFRQLRSRLGASQLIVIEESTSRYVYQFEFSSTDPDWPYDVCKFRFEVHFPASYPLQIFTIHLLQNDQLPESVRSSMEESINHWLLMKQDQLQKEDRLELVFRPFLLWLDRNLEDIVTRALKEYKRELEANAAGFVFIPAKPTATRERDLNVYDEKRGNGNEFTASNANNKTSDDENNRDRGSSTDDKSESSPVVDVTKTERRGTELAFRNLKFLEGIATLLVETLAVVVQCARCKNTTDIMTPPSRVNEFACPKCNEVERVVFRSSLCHQFAAVLGYADVDGCEVFDVILQDCRVTLACSECAKDMKDQMIYAGYLKETWCRSCHTKMRLSSESVRVTKLTTFSLTGGAGVHKVEIIKIKKVQKDPAIQEGKALPENGTCKHYKKSYRWFRFPCCGKCYPCDVCHEENEGGHEMKLANRIVCGRCCKEQPFSADRPCSACGQNMTKTRSAYWEGGRGCRDPTTMSRNDVHKYKNMSKTTSKKSMDTAKVRHTKRS